MLTPQSLRGIVRDSELSDGQVGKTIRFASAPKSLRKELIQSNPDSDEGQICAAIEIQRVFRGYCSRCRLLNVVHPQSSKTALYGKSQHDIQRMQDFQSPEPVQVSEGRGRLEKFYSDHLHKMESTEEEPASFKGFCANYIQSWWTKKKTQKATSSSTAVQSQQGEKAPPASPKKPQPTRKKREAPLSETEAATIIQKAWRQHILWLVQHRRIMHQLYQQGVTVEYRNNMDIQVYHYYRDLINFKQKGDPMMMLRCINPNEARMLDAASGIHIKFRLAGERFPPNIYYKIFTHRPIQDLCANSPKNYTSAETKRKMARDVHNKGNRIPGPDKSNWYVRSENNGWRLVSDRMLRHILSDPVTWETTNKKIQFHHNRIQRKQDVERKRKSKKIEWMKKMYRDGMLNAKVDDEETVRLIEGAAAGMVATIERQGEEAVQDWEVDELLEWTTSLNFEDYCSGWKEIATSANSEKAVEDRLNLLTSDIDPFDISLKVDPHCDGSTHQSHNTPASSRSASSLR